MHITVNGMSLAAYGSHDMHIAVNFSVKLYTPYEDLNRMLRRSCYLMVSVPLCTADLARQDETAAVCITRRQLHAAKCDQETGAGWQKNVGHRWSMTVAVNGMIR